MANLIATGKYIPLHGPILNGDFRMGPIWFYWLAIPAFFKSSVLTAIWVGLTASTKFIFAYWIGCRLYNKNFGLIFALSLLIPSWNQFELVVFSHTNIIQTSILLFCLLFLKYYQDKNPKTIKWLALSFSLALHAHPTTIGVGFFAIPFFIYWLTKRQIPIVTIFTSLLFFTIPFIPFIYEQWSLHWSLFNTIHTTNKHYFIIERLLFIPKILWAQFYTGPIIIFNYISQAISDFAGKLLIILYCATCLVACLGLIRFMFNGKKNAFAIVCFVFLAFMLLASSVLMKPVTSFYMSFGNNLIASFILAFGAYFFFTNKNIAILLMAILALTSLFFTSLATIKRNASDISYFNNQLADIKAKSNSHNVQHSNFDGYSVSSNNKLGEFMCKNKPNALLQGPFLSTIAYSLGLPTMHECNYAQIKTKYQDYYALLDKQAMAVINAKPKEIVAGYGVYRNIKVINPYPYNYPVIDKNYQHAKLSEYNPAMPLLTSAKQTLKQSTVKSNGNDSLIITNLYPFSVEYPKTLVEFDNKPINPAHENLNTKIFTANNSKAGEWTIKISDFYPQATNIIVVPAQ